MYTKIACSLQGVISIEYKKAASKYAYELICDAIHGRFVWHDVPAPPHTLLGRVKNVPHREFDGVNYKVLNIKAK